MHKLAFHDADTDTDTDPRRLPREDRREDVGVSGDFNVQPATVITSCVLYEPDTHDDPRADLFDTRAFPRDDVH